jgi:hypothetical protein
LEGFVEETAFPAIVFGLLADVVVFFVGAGFFVVVAAGRAAGRIRRSIELRMRSIRCMQVIYPSTTSNRILRGQQDYRTILNSQLQERLHLYH